MKPKWLSLVLVVLAAVVMGRTEEPAAKFGTLTAGAVVPDFTVTSPAGKPVKLSDYKGKVLVVGFWSPSRGPAEGLQNAFLQFQSLGAEVLGVCSGATREEFDQWVAKTKESLAYPLAWDAAGKAGDKQVLRSVFGLGVYPSTAVIDREGKLVGGFFGFGPQAPRVLRGYLREAGLAIPPEEEPKPAAGGGGPPPPSDDKTLKVGEVAPDFAAIDLKGATVMLSDFAGKVVVLDFWATWCGPCIASMPHTQKVAAETKAQGVVVFAACTSDTRAKFEEWLKANGAKYPDLVFANDPNGRETPPQQYALRASTKLYGVRGIPTQFVIGRDGKIAEVLVGFGGEKDKRLEQALEKLGVKIAP